MSTESPQAATTVAADADAARPWVQRVAGALTHRNFRLVWLAALGSTIGTWMQNYAQAWLVFDLTKSNFYLGLDTFLAQLPVLLFMLIGGVVADRYDRRRLLTGSQYVQMFSAFTLTALILSGHVKVWYIFLLSFVSGCGQAFGGPAYQSMIPQLVPRRDLPNAIALNSTQFNLSRVLGPTAGGIVLALVGTAGCFALNGLSFFFVVFALSQLQLPPHTPPSTKTHLSEELKSGLRYVRDNPLMLTLTVLVFVSTFLTMPILTMLPSFATDVLTNNTHAPQTRLSMLLACQGLGSIVGALTIGSLGRFKHMGRVLLVVQIILGVLIGAFALSRTLTLSLGLLFIGGMFFMAVFSISFSLVQLTAPDHLRGRVVSIYMVSLRGGWPIGSLVAGAMADKFTAPHVMAVNGLLLSAVAAVLLLFWRNSSLQQA
ncbi:MAG TPA: MFS transporter [Vicinamibacterales bacterium]|nr:MFS transporter [Vicinamibacterales bacterium]